MANCCRWLVPVLVLFLLAAHSNAQQQKVESDIRSVMDKYDVIGLSVVVVKDGNIHYSKAFGMKDLESETPLNEKDLFRIASISKSFSATAIMQLVEDGKVSLDDDFSDLVGFKVRNPKYPGKPITLQMVLSHTSSINDSQGYFNFDVINPLKNKDWAKCYNDYAPGAGYQYCNLNFNMAGAVIERLSGERFDSHIKKRILDPLGLYGGYCVDSLDNSLFTTLYGYDSSRFEASPMAYASRREEIEHYVMGYTTAIFSPTGGMKISAPDLAKYMMMHMNFGKYGDKRIISRKSAKRMQRVVWKEEGYGLALLRDENLIPGETMRGHTGNAYGLHSAMFFHPGKKFGFVVITNGCKPSFVDDMNTVLRDTIKILYERFIAE
jgi:CubicO group peptidase (beta-lactamase class C family)